MKISKHTIVLDAADIDALADFWAGVLDGTVQRDDDGKWNTVVVDDGPPIACQLAPNHVPPNWPEGQQQIHLDLYVEDVAKAHEEVIALGATMLQEAYEMSATEGFIVYADPAGHPFCLCW